MDFKSLKPMPDRAIVKISAQDRADIFTKKYSRPDGSTYSLIVTVDEEKGFDRKATLFVRTAEVISVGRQVRNVEVGDIAILDYLVDNDENIVLGWDGGDKYVSVRALSTYYKHDGWVYASRDQKQPKDIRVFKKDALFEASQILGCIRGDKLVANDPYVFIEHRTQGKRTTVSGIEYADKTPYAETKVLASSLRSAQKYGVENAQNVFVKFDDIFDVELSGFTICACNDEDVLLYL
jgi:hypothetical protein